MTKDDNASLAAVVAAGSSDTPQLTHVAHTPGPWKVYDHGDMWVAPLDVDAPVICDIGRHGVEFVYSLEDDANAHLIASAPDMYASLKEFAEMYADVHDMLGPSVAAKIGRLHAAIAKAEGR